jgi:hypothetical protein
MAEFKLGRIRFVWKGDWTASTTYYKDDVVRYGGKTFICQVGHSADSNFYTDLEFVPTKWNQMTDGSEWRDSWSTNTFYKENDIVQYGATIYICNTSHTSAATTTLGLEDDLSNWDVFVEGLDWKGNWTTATQYKRNDLVRYGGFTYVCITAHVSDASATLGLEEDSANWETFNPGIEYKGAWSASAVRYKINDVVQYGAGLWICTTIHTSAGTFASEQANWSQFVKGFEFEEEWAIGTTYQPGDVVRYGGNQYVAKTNHVGEIPSTSTLNWALFTEGFNYVNDWAYGTSYRTGDVARVNGNTYIAIADAPSATLTITNTTAASDNFTSSTINTGLLSAGMSVRFTGTTFGNVFTGSSYYVNTIPNSLDFTIAARPGGTKFEVVTASGSMTATFGFHPAVSTSRWQLLTKGINWAGVWTDDREYELGDAVRFGSNAYICVQKHRSEGDDGSTVGATGGGSANSRPDQDTTATFWNVLSIGSETSVLTTRGDLVFFNENGPARLPVGLEGQILRVSEDNLPEWISLGAADFTYYVAPSGTDGPAPIHGLSWDKPFKTIRYATEQVERGPRNPIAKRLLELNRVFIQREVTEWIQNQIATAGGSGIWAGFVYDDFKCERDTGFIIDALMFDLSHGGNVKTRGAAQAFVNTLLDSPGEYSLLGTEKDNDIAAWNYMLEVVEAVLNQEAPAVNYQILNADNSTKVVDQWFDSSLGATEPVLPTINQLVTIIVNALEDEDASRIPARYAPANLINVATGRYRETLPIIVPEQTCILGAELRSTNTGPAGSLVDMSDVRYSLGALGRLEAIISDIVTGANITESSGNTEVQDIDWPLAGSGEGNDLKLLVRAMAHKIDFTLGTTVLQSSANPTNYNTSYLSGYGDARTLLRENKKFMQDEVIAFIAANYPSVKYSKTACRRDVGFIIDAMAYDLTYGGNAMSVQAGLAYYDGPGSQLMIDSTEITATVAAYGRLKTVMQSIVSNSTVTRSSSNTSTQWTDSGLSGGSSATALIGANIDIITNIIAGDSTAGNPPQVRVTSVTTGNVANTAANHGLSAGDTFVPEVSGNGFTANTTYYVLTTPALNQFTVSLSFGGSAATLTNGTGLDIEGAIVNRPATAWVAALGSGLVTAYTSLSAQAPSIATNTISFLTSNYPNLVYNQAKCSRDVRIIIDAVAYDFMFNSNFQTVKAAYAYLRSSASEVFNLGQKAATRAALQYVKTSVQANVSSNVTAQTRTETLMTLLDSVLYAATNEGSTCATGERTADWAVLKLEHNRDYVLAEIDAWINSTYRTTATNTAATTNLITVSDTSWLQRNAAIKFTGVTIGGIVAGQTYYVQNVVSSTTFKIAATRNTNTPLTLSTATGSMTVTLVYDSALCLRDVGEYLNALKYDLKYPGNYKSLLAARYYYNAVRGSLEEDMYYLRDGTGIRDQTMEGLTGDLLAPNEFGTSRVSGGAYCSLDPGWGPDDFRTWIITRSPYVQGLTTIGYGAIGQKIDGALHNGGNDSIVSNDFTQVISDGIGAWVANNGRAELVSVFTYYSHIGYLSTEGGRIRGTNGNNSYGDFGSVAEGFDATETPNTATVDNKFQFNATVGSVITDGDDILTFEFENAGIDYNEAVWTITGGGISAASVANEFRDGGVYAVRLTEVVDPDPVDDAAYNGQFGGFGYITNSNTSQGGTTSSITLAATDAELSTAYIGMKVLITGGRGVGQFGIITTYNNGTKNATVVRESDGVAGWDHVVPGTPILGPDASTTYIVEPAISFAAPTYSSAAGTSAASAAYGDILYTDTIATYNAITGTASGSGINATFNVLRKGSKYSVFVAAGGTGYARLETVTIPGTAVGGASPANDLVITVTSLNTTTGAILRIEHEGVGIGGNYVAIRSDASDDAITSTGGAWTSNPNNLPASATWSAMAAGRLTNTVVITATVAGQAYRIATLGTANNFVTIGASVAQVGTDFIANAAGFGDATVTPLITRIVAIVTGSNATAYSDDGGVTWTTGGNLPSSGTWNTIAYGDGRFVALKTGSQDSAYSDNGGVSWTLGGVLPVSTTWSSVTFGANKWVAVASGGTNAVSSVNGGVTWLTRVLPATSNWSSVTFGNNRFVAVSSSTGTASAYSLNGFDWEAGTITSGAYNSVTYGQGVFLAVGNTTTASSSESGLVWTSRTISTSNNASVAFGNVAQTPRFRTISSSGATNTSEIICGARARARAFVAQNRIFAIRITEPGSAYTSAPTMTITDPNDVFAAPFTVRVGSGVLATPTFNNRGVGYATGSAEIFSGNGYADFFQTGSFVAVRRLSQRPVPGSNVVFDSLPDRTFKLVTVVTFLGDTDGSYTAFFQVSPAITINEAPAHGTGITTRIRYSQVRLTGHDFLDIGTGNFVETNYPGAPTQDPIPSHETVANNGGRVFYTSTDQDGNFRVGELFSIEQSTGIATLNADAFNISGLQELNLGNVTLGGGSATITEFSTDPFFTADSDNVVPTQRAIKAYIASQIGGGGAALNVNSVTAGSIFINSNQITTTTGVGININATFEFRRGVTGVPLALNYYFK